MSSTSPPPAPRVTRLRVILPQLSSDLWTPRFFQAANLEKNPSMRLSHDPCLGVKVNSKRPAGRVASQALVSLEMCAE